VNRLRACGLRPLLLIPWLVLTLTDGGIHEHGPPSGAPPHGFPGGAATAAVFVAFAGSGPSSSDSYCSACIWQLTAHYVLVSAPALPPPTVPSISLSARAVEGPALARPRPTARAPPSR